VIEQLIKFLYRVWQRISNAIKDILFFYFNIHARTRCIETYDCVDNYFLIVSKLRAPAAYVIVEV